jgi:hypothetical protein
MVLRGRMSMRFGELHRRAIGRDGRFGVRRRGVMGRWDGFRKGEMCRDILVMMMVTPVMQGSEDEVTSHEGGLHTNPALALAIGDEGAISLI